jgi:acyl-CoA synthetase (NDP forming)
MLEALFRPKAVAVIGASTKELSIGNRVIKNLIDYKYKGPVYPINPKADEIRGLKAYKSIADVPGDIDLVHMVIASKFVPMAVEDCGKKGVKAIIVNTAGFKEIGPKGEAIEKQMLEVAAKYGIRIFGPNCQGIINTDPELRAYCNFTFTFPEPGNISIVAQSGGVGELIHQGFSEMGVGTRIYASNGNACDVSITECIKYLGDDDGTRVIVLYVEGLPNPAEFMEVVKDVAAKKPILAMKAGRTREGAKAASSHTGGLAEQDIATELIFEKFGLLTFRDEGDLCEAAALFAMQPVPKGNRVGIITNTGGPAIIATDVLVDAGLEIPPLSKKAEDYLKEHLFDAASINNPVDVLATGPGEHFRAAVDAMMDEDTIDSVYINFVTPFFVDNENTARQIVEVSKQQKKPIVCNLMTDKRQWTEVIKILKEGGVPFFSFPGTAARALANMSRYAEISSRKIGEPEVFSDVNKAAAKSIIDKAGQEGRKMLSANEVYTILDAYKIPVAQWRTAGSPEEAEKAAEEIGCPVVLKADAESIVHKSDMGGVAVNLADSAAVRAAADAMKNKFDAPDLQFFVQKFIPGGKEVILGAKR